MSVSTKVLGGGHKEVTYEEVRVAIESMELVRPIMSFAYRMNDSALGAISSSPLFKRLGSLDFVVNHPEVVGKVTDAYEVLQRAEKQEDVAGDEAREYWRKRNVPPVAERLLPPYKLSGPDGKPLIPVAIWISQSRALQDFESLQNDKRLSKLAEREYQYPKQRVA